MEPDAAADLVQSLPEKRRWQIVALLPPLLRQELRELLSYKPKTAGGLMTPQFARLSADATKTDSLQNLERSDWPAYVRTTPFVTSKEGRVTGSIAPPDLLRAAAEQRLGEIARPAPVSVKADAGFEELARLMSDYNLTPGRRSPRAHHRRRRHRRRLHARRAEAVAAALRLFRKRMSRRDWQGNCPTPYHRPTRTITLRAVLRLLIGPLAVAAFAGVQLARYGIAAAAIGAYVTFLVSHHAVRLWARYRLHRARKRLAALRESRRR